MNFLPAQRSLSNLNHAWKPRVTCAAVLGVLTTIITAILCVHFTSAFISSIQVFPNPEHWTKIARTQAYGVCYDGCDDCLEVDSIEQACRLTTEVEISGITCDASMIWSWEDRYPIECLQALGQIYKADALRRKRFWFKALYLLTILSIPLGYLVYLATYWVLKRFNVFDSTSSRPRVRRSHQSASSNSTTPLLAAAILALALPTPVLGYACVNQHPAHNQLFSNVDNTIYGVIHGWLSDCYDYTYSCGEKCHTTASSNEDGCNPIYCTEPRSGKSPRDYVNEGAEYVTGCGFRRVDVVPGVVDMRIPNPRIEGRLWVKVAVNRFNGTEGLEDQVRCLYNMIEAPRR